jgi:hypothetical protein
MAVDVIASSRAHLAKTAQLARPLRKGAEVRAWLRG